MKNDTFDPEFYRAWYKDIRGLTPELATAHWEKAGRAEGRLANYPQLLAHRKAAGLVLPPDFRWKEYLALNGDLPRPGQWTQVNAEMHYLDSGLTEGRHHTQAAMLKARKLQLKNLPSGFNWLAYLALNPKLIAIHINSRYLAEAHYLEYGEREGLAHFFDADFYREYHQLDQLAPKLEAALGHYEKVGSAKKLAPSFQALLEQQGFSSALLPARFDFTQFKALHSGNRDLTPYHSLQKLLSCESLDATPVSKQPGENLAFYKHLGLEREKQGYDHLAYRTYSCALAFGLDGAVFESLGNIALRASQKVAALSYYKMAAAAGGHSPFVFINGAKILLEQAAPENALDWAAQGVLTHTSDASFLESNLREICFSHWDQTAQAVKGALILGDRDALIAAVQQMAQKQFDTHAALLNPTGGALPLPLASGRSVLIVGDHHIPQCIRYRIQQKVEQLRTAGYRVVVTDAAKPAQAREALPWCDAVIFYRVAALPDIVQLMASARSHGKVIFYEVDDLVIDPAYPHSIDTFGGLVDVQQHQDLQQGMALMRAAARLCDYGIASTRPLQKALEKLVRQKVCYLHRNGLDSQTLIPTEAPRPETKGYVNLFYGSGTKSHNSDFITEALPAISRLLAEHPHVKLTVVGHLELPEAVRKQHAKQIVQIEHVGSVQAYWNYLAASDINLAVLTPDAITHTKSELKWFEAACFNVPSVVSATQNYLDVIQQGVDGLIAHTPEDWYQHLGSLIADQALRQTVGQAARERVLKEYSVSALAESIDQTIKSATAHARRQAQRKMPRQAEMAAP